MRILRDSNDYSQEYVANVLGITQKTYSSVETGRSKLTLERIMQLADLYKVKPDYFLLEELPVVNYNTGTYSRSVIAQNSFEGKADEQSEKLFERIIKEKDTQISFLIKELDQMKLEKQELFELLRRTLAKTEG
ncbi:helix-turn-helix domain-containing protein [Algoriphagus sp.]|uniref:helix-turn-helix domain-containing protein n=1 Tax=Algoriphagus sp. TaxID=1872435 RepID=UPI0027188E66|nr:helix-turn-helix transcriptional regulator [Algoriphagus sp.]MDO8965062.1 helix-turn-helix transcriptional regulator [Algoriphagus sp.]MDP3201871.1 helix-turn-helix transcriptional regulator [Algoriphagus sp.]